MTNECADTTGRWGHPCPSCGQTLPSWNRDAYFRAREEEKNRRLYLYRNPNMSLAAEKSDRQKRYQPTRPDW